MHLAETIARSRGLRGGRANLEMMVDTLLVVPT